MFYPENFTAVPNAYMEDKSRLSASVHQVMKAILRYTAGFQRYSHILSTSFLARACDLTERTVRAAVARLQKLKYIQVCQEKYQGRLTKKITLQDKVFGRSEAAEPPGAVEPAAVPSLPESGEITPPEPPAQPVCQPREPAAPEPVEATPVPPAIPTPAPVPVPAVPPSNLTDSLLGGLVQLGMQPGVARNLLQEADPKVVQQTLADLPRFKAVENPVAFVYTAIKRGGYQTAPCPDKLVKRKHEQISEQRRREDSALDAVRQQAHIPYQQAFQIYRGLSSSEQQALHARARVKAGVVRTGTTFDDCPVLRGLVLDIIVEQQRVGVCA